MYPNLVVLSQVTDDLSKYSVYKVFNAPKIEAYSNCSDCWYVPPECPFTLCPEHISYII